MYRLQRYLLPFAFLLVISCDSPSTDDDMEKVTTGNNAGDTLEWDTDTVRPNYNEEGDGSEDIPDVDEEEGTGEGEDPYSVMQLITLGEGELDNMVYVRGYVVGSVSRSAISGSRFGTDEAVRTNLLIADSPRETDYKRCISVGLTKGEMRNAMNLVDNPHRLGQLVTVCGVVSKYMYILGIPTPLMIENPD